MTFQPTWKASDVERLMQLRADGFTIMQMMEFTPFTYHAIANVFRRKKLPPTRPNPMESIFDVEYKNKYGDLKFKKAMIAAVNDGSEKVRFGVFKTRDCDDFRPTHFTPMPALSLLGSPALSCADFA